MIIIAGKSGQLGNSLVLYAGFVAYSIERNVKVYNPSFYRYASYFDFTSQNYKLNSRFAFNSLFWFTRILIKLKIRNAKEIDWHESVDLDTNLPFGNINTPLFVQGWQYRGNACLEKHKVKILNLFTPKKIYLEKLNAFFEQHFSNSEEIIIAVHIRRGDYRTFENGKYFYSIDQYQQLMNNVAELFTGSKIHFLVCSNETYTVSDFAGVNHTITFGLAHELLDMYSMARCHYIIGPPSTYTMWASFYGSTPLCMVHDINKQIELKEFKVQSSF